MERLETPLAMKVAEYIAECQRVLEKTNLTYKVRFN